MSDAGVLNAAFPNMMLGISGARGIVGEGLNPSVVARLSAAFASTCDSGDIIIARDSRVSGAALACASAGGICSAGCEALDAGVLTTPGAQLLVEECDVAGGIMITASHNPPQWNGLKFIGSDGAFPGLETVNDIYRIAATSEVDTVSWDTWKNVRTLSGGNGAHVRHIVESGMVDIDAIRSAGLTVVMDTNRGAAGPLFRMLCTVFDLNGIIEGEEPSGCFIHGAEPIPEHLESLAVRVRQSGADFGVAVDPDGDRLIFCLPDGSVLPEEATLPITAEAVLCDSRGPLVTNLSTSSMIDEVGARHNVDVYRTAVGEAHVVSAMREYSAVFGGEGNGGVIVPGIHYGRDAAVGLALVLSYLSVSGNTLTDVWNEIPRRFMRKVKIARGTEPLDHVFRLLAESIHHEAVDDTDGLRLETGDGWLHVRPSNTEPVLRIVAEASSERRLHEIINHANHVLGTRHE